MPFQIVRQVVFRGEVRLKTIDVAGNQLRIGRGTANDLHLEELAVSLTHAVITLDAEGCATLRDLTGTGATYVNQIPISQERLRDGDRIRIQGYVLTVTQAGSAESLVVRVEERPRVPEDASVGLMPKLQLTQGRWTRVRLSILLSALVLGVAVASWLVGKPGVLMPGAVSLKHAKFADQCDKCHVGWKAVWNVVPNKTCQVCHPAEILTPSHFGDRALGTVPPCASCHLEHKGHTFLADVRDGHCVQCHGDLKVKDATMPVGTTVRSFTDDHPEFALTVPGSSPVRRVRLSEKSAVKDYGHLKLNHEVHLAPDLPSLTGRETLTCTSCHRLEPDGRYLQPMKFERDCMRCHALEFDPQLPGRSVTHGRQPVEVRKELEEIYAAFFMRTFSDKAKESGGVRRLPGQPPTAQELYVEGRTERAERILYPPGGKKCLKCHSVEGGVSSEEWTAGHLAQAKLPAAQTVLESDESADVDALRNAPGARAGTTTEEGESRQMTDGQATEPDPMIAKSEYFEGHKLDNADAKRVTGSRVFNVVPVNVPIRWLPYSRFDHAAHFGLAEIKKKGNVCLACHESVSTSRRTEDVLLPAIGLCRTCHMEPGGAQAGCKACHDFHPKSTPPTAVRNGEPTEAARAGASAPPTKAH